MGSGMSAMSPPPANEERSQNLSSHASNSTGDEEAATDTKQESPAQTHVSARFRNFSLTTPIEMVGFWTAVALPFLYVPLLLAGLNTPAETITFAALLVLNVIALFVGHSYKQQ